MELLRAGAPSRPRRAHDRRDPAGGCRGDGGAVVSAMEPARAEERLLALGIELPEAPTPFGAYVPAVQSGALPFLRGRIPRRAPARRPGRRQDLEPPRRRRRQPAPRSPGGAGGHLRGASVRRNAAQAPTAEMAVTPPSIRKSAPTTYAESSDAR